MNGKKQIDTYIIRNFLLVVLGIAICEIFVNIIYSYMVFPFLRNEVGGPVFEQFGQGGYGSSVVYSAFFWLVMGIVMSLLPSWFSNTFYHYLGSGFEVYLPAQYNLDLHSMSDGMLLYYVGCLVILILLVVAAALPYIIGGYVFTRLIHDELHYFKNIEKEKHMEYERKRSLMLSDIAHDLKTPITTISGYAQALRDDVVEDEQKKKQYLDAICQKSKRMDDLIGLFFEYVKIDSEGFSLHKEKIDLAELFRENIALFYSDFERKGIGVELDIPEESVIWELDRIQFSRALSNLIGNELRHVEKGKSILMKMQCDEEQEEVRIVLGDTGEQIEDSVAQHIFEPFVMGDSSRNSKGGSGLGLSIASKIVKMHGAVLYLDRNSTKDYTKAFVIVLRK